VYERVKPLFECLGKTLNHMGAQGAGQATKACNQLSLTVTLQGVAEAMLLAQAYGVDPAKVRDVMLGGVAASRVLDLFGRRMVDGNYDNGIDARLYHKDVHIVLELAHEMGLPLPACALVMQSFNALMAQGRGTQDAAALFEVLRSARGART
jgi:2-hydroxy-3-oxopropionate reductase